MDHFERFRDIGLVLRQYPEDDPPYLRAVTLAQPDAAAVKDVLVLYQTIITELTKAYSTGRVEERAAIIQAREAMTKLNDLAENLAGRGIGIPFF